MKRALLFVVASAFALAACNSHGSQNAATEQKQGTERFTETIFWDRFNYYAVKYGFVPWIISLLDNHYHTLGYLRIGESLRHQAQNLHLAGSQSCWIGGSAPA